MSKPATATLPEMVPLPPGRHGIPAELVRESQRRRLMTAAAEMLAASGYGRVTTTEVTKRAKVSTAAFYKHFDDLWDCLLAAYEADAELLCEQIASSFAAAAGTAGERGQAAIESALSLLATDPAVAHLLSAEPPPQAMELREARGRLIARLAALLQGAREGSSETEAQWLVGGALALVSSATRDGTSGQLGSLAPTLAGVLLEA